MAGLLTLLLLTISTLFGTSAANPVSSQRSNSSHSEYQVSPEYQLFDSGVYTALQGPLRIVIKGNSSLWSPRFPEGELTSEYLKLSVHLPPSQDEVWGVIVGPIVRGVQYDTNIPCGVVAVGGNHIIRLHRTSQLLSEITIHAKWPQLKVTPPSVTSASEASLSGKCKPLRSTSLESCAELIFQGDIPPTPPPSSTETPRHRREASNSPPGQPSPQKGDFCPPVNSSATSGGRQVLERIKLNYLYDNRGGALLFDCQFLSDNKVFSIKVYTDTGTPVPLQAFTKEFTVSWQSILHLNVSSPYMKLCHGSVSVDTSQPLCRSSKNKLRVYALEPYNVDSVNPPVNYRYVSEHRVTHSSLNIPCSVFVDGPIHYCFSYVYVATNGAVTEVDRVCRPTLRPGVSMRHGSWGPWSSWSECSPPCGEGTRRRYRQCDSPPPMNRGNYCQGNMTDFQPCQNPECDLPPAHTTTQPSKNSTRCSCGCVINLVEGRALSFQTDVSKCDYNATWIVNASSSLIEATLYHTSLASGSQWMKVRDGNSSIAPLLLTLPTHHEELQDEKRSPLFPYEGVINRYVVKEITTERFDQMSRREVTGIPFWRLRSSDSFLRLEIHTFVNVSNITAKHSLGFAMLLKPTKSFTSPLLDHEPFIPQVKKADTWYTYINYVNITALAFLIAILLLIMTILAVHSVKYRAYMKRKVELRSLTESQGSSTDVSLYECRSPGRFGSLQTIAEILSLASMPFSRREGASYSQLNDRNCVPLRSKSQSSSINSIPMSPFCGSRGAPVASFMRRKKRANKFKKNRLSASCDDLECKFIFPIKEENVMTSSISETELSSCIDDSGTESLKVARRKGRVPVIKKPQSNKGNFAHIKKVKNLSPQVMRNSTNDKNGQPLRPKNWMRVRRTNGKEGNGARSPLTLPKMMPKNTALASSASELSTAGVDLEYDYYDYDMGNASAVPGSLFGLDPTLMPWLPSILNIDEEDDDDDSDLFVVNKVPLSVSQSTLKEECIPMQEISKRRSESLAINLDSGNNFKDAYIINKTESLGNKLDDSPESNLSASKAISLSSTDNSGEIPFADDDDEDEDL